MTRALIVKNIFMLLVLLAGISTGPVAALELSGNELPTSKDLRGLAVMQAEYEEVRSFGGFTSTALGELAYYYSEQVPVETTTLLSPNKRHVQTTLTDCSGTFEFPESPKFLYGGLDPYSLIARAERDSEKTDLTYANFFPATKRDLGTCENFSVLRIETGLGIFTDYVVLFKSQDNKNKFEDELIEGAAPMPAAGFWCLWGLGGGRPHFAVPNNPQFAVYKLDDKLLQDIAKQGYFPETGTYIGANYWLRIHGMGSPNVLGRISDLLEEFKESDKTVNDFSPYRFKSIIFHDPLE